MEKVTSGRFTKVGAVDDIAFNANHEYCIGRATLPDGEFDGEFGYIKFQKGPIKENGINGCHHEDLLAIVLHRLNYFQNSEFKCRENALAITKIEEALHWLDHRTKDRQGRGVEGTSAK